MNTIQTKQNIDKAIASHGMWKMRLKNAIKTHSTEFEVAFVKSPHHCDFGKWLNNDKFELAKFSEYNEIVDLHKELHVETARIMELALAAKDSEAAASLVVGSKFSTLSSKLTIAMMNWKKKMV